MHHNCTPERSPSVEYHVIHSPSYQVPILYFQLHQLPSAASRGLETAYERLVPRCLKSGLRAHSIVGGISMAVGVLRPLKRYFC